MSAVQIKYIILITSSVACIVLFYLGTQMYPLCSDDMSYKFICGLNEQVSSICDVFTSQFSHYMRVNGRFVSHCAVQSVLMLDRMYFCMANTLCYAFFAVVIAMLVSQSRERRLEICLVVLLSFWVLMPMSGSTMFWLTGAFNYLWTSYFSCVFLLFLFSQAKWAKYLALCIGIVAGNGHECISIGITVALVLYVLASPKQDKWFYAGVFCYLIGTMSVVFAPGTFYRLSKNTIAKEEIDLTLFIVGCCKTAVKLVWVGIFKDADFSFRFSVGLWCILLAIAVRGIKKGEKKYVFPLCVLIGALSTISLNIASKCIYSRSLYGFCFLTYLAFFFVIGKMQWKYQILMKCLVLGLVAVNIIEIPKAYRSITILNSMYNQIEEHVKEQRTLVPEVSGWQEARLSRYVEAYGVYPSILMNGAMIRYFNGQEVSILPKNMCGKIFHCLGALSQAKIHQRVAIDDELWLVKLKARPLSASVSVYIRPYVPACMAWAVHRLIKPHQVVKALPVICINEEYYVYGSGQESLMPLYVEYSEQEKCMISPASIKHHINTP